MEAGEKSTAATEYYYDYATFSLIAVSGLEKFIRKHPESEESLRPLEEVLRDETIPVTTARDLPKMTKKVALKRGRIISDLVSGLDDLKLNEDLLLRTGKLGITPTLFGIQQMFGSTSRFYQAIGDPDSHRTRVFSEWTTPQFLKYLESVAEESGKRPTWDGLQELSNSDPKRPSPLIIIRRLGSKGIAPLLELLGYPNVHGWNQEEYVEWGARFTDANRGQLPSGADLAFLSHLDRGPSARAVMNNFGTLKEYQSQVDQAYQKKQAENHESKSRMLESIAAAMEAGSLPAGLFEGAGSSDSVIRRYARYSVVTALIGDNYAQSRLTISKKDDLDFRDRRMLWAVRKINQHITAGDLESTALYLGLFDILMPFDEYKEKLRILKVKRGQKIMRLAFDKAISDL